MLSNPALVSAIYLIVGSLFLLFLFIGAVSTIARVIYYRVNGYTRPRLLTRDVIVFGGLAFTFAAITIVRFLPTETRMALTAGNVAWALVSTLPAVVAIMYYAYVEVFVIERPKR